MFWILVGKSTMLERLKYENRAANCFCSHQLGNLCWYHTYINSNLLLYKDFKTASNPSRKYEKLPDKLQILPCGKGSLTAQTLWSCSLQMVLKLTLKKSNFSCTNMQVSTSLKLFLQKTAKDVMFYMSAVLIIIICVMFS